MTGILFVLIPVFIILIWLIGALVIWGVKALLHRALRKPAHNKRAGRLRRTILDQVSSKDPNFDLDALMNRAASIVGRIEGAVRHDDLTSVRPFASVTGLGCLRAQTVALKAWLGTTEGGDRRIEPTDFEQTPEWNQIAVGVHGPASSSSHVKGWRTGWVFWFGRKSDATTEPGRDVLSGRCPGCGAESSFALTNVCEHCHAVAGSGEHDWALFRVTESYFRS